MCKLLRHHLILITLLISTLLIGGCTGSKTSNGVDLRFTFIGDLHYAIRNDYAITDYFIPRAKQELDRLNPPSELVIQTGDLFHSSRGTDIESEAAYAFKHLSETLALPVFVAKGNHDDRDPFEKNAFPMASNQLNRPITRAYYSFEKANSHFIILDCTDRELTDQLHWLEQDLQAAASNPDIEHIFVAGHYPLWTVARAGFTRPGWAKSVTALLAKYQVDAYFCGHTHNKSLTVKQVDGNRLTQIMGVATVEEGRLFDLAPFLRHVGPEPDDPYRPGLLPLEEAHTVFSSPPEFDSYWGYQEGSTGSYCIVTVRGTTVQVDFHVLGGGMVRSVEWETPGRVRHLKKPDTEDAPELTGDELAQVQQAWLYAAPWTPHEQVTSPVFINGIAAGELTIDGPSSYFWNKIELPLNPAVNSAFTKQKNIVRIANPGSKEFGLAHMYILVRLPDGRFAKSSVSSAALASFHPAADASDFPVESRVLSVDRDHHELQTTNLTFDRILQRNY